jgi:enoyl-CoA hydratase/carnithine racemase
VSLRVEDDGGVRTLTIDREDRRNALNADVLHALLDALREPGARVVVLTGAGDKAFCAGADLGPFDADATPLDLHEGRGLLREVLLAMRSCPAPVVARVQGLCLAGGVGLALGCDVVVSSDTAEYGLPEVNIGLWPFMVGALVARHVSPKRALDLMLTGRRISAHEALGWGLVSRVVPSADLDATVAEVCDGIVAKSPLVLRLGKAAWYGTEDMALEQALAALQAQLSLLSQSHDAVEGITAFFQKRPPTFTGR